MAKQIRGVFTSDWHYPNIDKSAYRALLRFIKSEQPQVVVFGGDIFDFNTLSPKYLPDHLLSGQDVRKQIRDGMQLVEAVAEQAEETYWLDGNHEDRPTKLLLAKAAALHGFYNFHDDVLKLGDLAPSPKKVVRYENGNGSIRFGDPYHGLVVCHGWLCSRATPGATARAHAQALDCSVIHGHSHECETTQVPQPNRIIWACSAGGLFDITALRRQYAVWPKWRHGFAYFELQGDRVSIVESIPIHNGRALWRGRKI